ncbi:hypothetical protein F2P81_011350 [Scophthalmus maximus]|uniref:Uncharacterized protein n=1 Tax=Scophthalmus maximus TaxID=52904 RepID=A0A6A4SVB1_SCOMX|nr:hypothetical protein F2P81_011350 [Scophthalmus maximus]
MLRKPQRQDREAQIGDDSSELYTTVLTIQPDVQQMLEKQKERKKWKYLLLFRETSPVRYAAAAPSPTPEEKQHQLLSVSWVPFIFFWRGTAFIYRGRQTQTQQNID